MYAAVTSCCYIFATKEVVILCGRHASWQEELLQHRLSRLGCVYHFTQPIFIKCYFVPGAGQKTDQSSRVSVQKFYNIWTTSLYLSVEYFCLNEVSPIPTLPTCSSCAQWTEVTSLLLWAPDYAQPVSPGEWGAQELFRQSQSPKIRPSGHQTVIKKKFLYCKWPLHPVCCNERSVFCIPSKWRENASHLMDVPAGPPGGTVDPMVYWRANGKYSRVRLQPSCSVFHIGPCVLVLLGQSDCKLLENTLWSLGEDYLS